MLIKEVNISVQQAVEAYKIETSRIPHLLDNWLTDGEINFIKFTCIKWDP
jgi:hypothetical protein